MLLCFVHVTSIARLSILRRRIPRLLVPPKVLYFSLLKVSWVFPLPIEGSKGKGCHICTVCQSPLRHLTFHSQKLCIFFYIQSVIVTIFHILSDTELMPLILGVHHETYFPCICVTSVFWNFLFTFQKHEYFKQCIQPQSSLYCSLYISLGNVFKVQLDSWVKARAAIVNLYR